MALDLTDNTIKPVLMFEIDLSHEIDPITLVDHSPGVWQTRITFPGRTIVDDYGVVGYFPAKSAADLSINSARIAGEFYQRVYSFTSLRLQNKSFYIDGESNIYIHFDNWEPPFAKLTQLGASSTYATRTDTGAYHDGQFYEARVQSAPKLQRKVDPLFYGVIRYDSNTVDLDNSDGALDNLNDAIYSRSARYLFGVAGVDRSEFLKVYEGMVETFSLTRNKATIKLQDKRKLLTRPLPKNRYTLDEYMFLDERNIDKPIPLAYGYIRRGEAICLNEDETSPATYTFKFMDTEHHSATELIHVRVDGVPKTPASVDLSEGTFIFNSGDVVASGRVLPVSCEFIGADIHNALDAIKDIMTHYIDVAYIVENYNIDEWVAERSNVYDIGLLIDEAQDAIEILKKIAVSCLGDFMVQDDGRFTFRTFQYEKEPVATIEPEEVFEFALDRPSDQFLSSVTIKYDHDHVNDWWRTFINNEYEEEVWLDYHFLKGHEIESVLVNPADAEALASRIMQYSRYIPEIVKITVPAQYMILELRDFVRFSKNRVTDKERKYGIYEIIGIDKDMRNYKVKLELRYVRVSE